MHGRSGADHFICTFCSDFANMSPWVALETTWELVSMWEHNNADLYLRSARLPSLLPLWSFASSCVTFQVAQNTLWNPIWAAAAFTLRSICIIYSNLTAIILQMFCCCCCCFFALIWFTKLIMFNVVLGLIDGWLVCNVDAPNVGLSRRSVRGPN